jgi:hypothetical protein
MAKTTTPGRDENSAQPLGERHGTDSEAATEATAKREQDTAGPDGPSAKAVGDTFKRKPQA